jgi:quercetin dioxygenase-like cupin family protein
MEQVLEPRRQHPHGAGHQPYRRAQGQQDHLGSRPRRARRARRRWPLAGLVRDCREVSFPKTGKPLEWAQWQDLIDQVSAEHLESASRAMLVRLLNCAKGSSIPRYEHLGAGEYYVISGKMEVRGGVENGGITAIAGDYGYEPNGVIHDMTNFPEDTILYFTNFGADPVHRRRQQHSRVPGLAGRPKGGGGRRGQNR